MSSLYLGSTWGGGAGDNDEAFASIEVMLIVDFQVHGAAAQY